MDHYFYTNTINMALTILFLYIDDMLIMRLYIDVIKEMKEWLAKIFEIKDLRGERKILGTMIVCNYKGGTLVVS